MSNTDLSSNHNLKLHDKVTEVILDNAIYVKNGTIEVECNY